jgi:hypothetical protein
MSSCPVGCERAEENQLQFLPSHSITSTNHALRKFLSDREPFPQSYAHLYFLLINSGKINDIQKVNRKSFG